MQVSLISKHELLVEISTTTTGNECFLTKASKDCSRLSSRNPPRYIKTNAGKEILVLNVASVFDMQYSRTEPAAPQACNCNYNFLCCMCSDSSNKRHALVNVTINFISVAPLKRQRWPKCFTIKTTKKYNQMIITEKSII